MAAKGSPSISALQEVLDRHGWFPKQTAVDPASPTSCTLDVALAMSVELAGKAEPQDLKRWRDALYAEARRRLFPSRFPPASADVAEVARYFFPLALGVVEERVRRGGDGFAVRLPFRPLRPEEISPWPSGGEYRRLLTCIEEDGLLASLAMAQEWQGFSIADHVLGVTALALWIGRQLARAVPVDLPLLHGAAIGHDVGKFGCLGDEERRIPRLHYYYTHLYYQERNLPGLGHIATNHSTWDLEAVRLPVETQLLIYADFRSKEARGEDGVQRMSIISLRDAFEAIRDKLEDLDAAKLARYETVYRRLRDLEDYLVVLGVELDPPGFRTAPPTKPRLPKGLDIVEILASRQRPDVVALATGREIPAVSRFFATAHNIGVMEKLRDLPALRALLEEARSTELWRDLRTYLGVLGEYAPALSMEQKELALGFFFDLLAHRDDDIRYHAANRIGDLLALGEDSWRKDLPDGVIPEQGSWVLRQFERVLALLDRAGPEPEQDMGVTERVLYAIPIVVRRLLRHADAKLRDGALDLVFERHTGRVGDRRPLVGLYVCESFEVALPFMTADRLPALVDTVQAWAHHEVVNVRLMAWRVLLGVARREDGSAELRQKLRYYAELLGRRLDAQTLIAELFVLEELARCCGLDRLAERCRALRETNPHPVRDVMLRNLKTRVGWVEKKVNCDFLVDYALARVGEDKDPESHFANEVASHLANLLKVSRVEGTRFHAGRGLLRLLTVLTVPQRNDLMVELLRSLELDVEAVTRYIPRFLGSVMASLPEQEFQEAIEDVELHVRRGSDSLQRLLLQTAGWVLLSLPAERVQGDVLRRLAGVLLGALGESRPSTVHEGFAEIAMVLERLLRRPTADRRLALFLGLVTKKLLSLVTHRAGDRGRFFLVASALNHLERALRQAKPHVSFPVQRSVAYIPGTFDPFTRAHTEIVTRVLGHVDEVLVQVDDYSWNKHAQPRQLRKELAWMALAPLPGAFLAPFEPPINLANATSVKALRRKLGRRGLTLVVGSDVLEGASAYKDATSHVWDVPHLVVARENVDSRRWEEKLGWFRAAVQVARIPHQARLVSSTSLRSALDRREDLEALCDPLVGRTLLERQLYVNYPSKKEPVRPPRFSLAVQHASAAVPAGMHSVIRLNSLPSVARWAGKRCETCVLIAREGGKQLAALTWREVAAAALPVVLGDRELARLPEGRLAGLGALVDVVALSDSDEEDGAFRMLLSLVMSRWLDAGLQFAVVGASADGTGALWEALQECGAGWLTDGPATQAKGLRWASIRLTDPLVLVWDMEAVLQPPYAAAPEVQKVVERDRRALARFFAERTPGGALFHLYERETKRTVVEWAKERLAEERSRRRWVVLGLGRQFYRDVIGETPTLALDLERFLTWQGYEGGVHPSQGSPSLALQLHTARELGHEALLLIPFLEAPEPVQQVHATAKAAGIALREVLIGVTSASVHATLHLQGIAHRCGVVVPRWQGVLRESALAPYIGGWSILGRDPLETGSLLPSLNDCLPYHHPHPVGLDGEAALDFSRLALAHTRGLFETVEEIFRNAEGRLLNVRDLGMVVRTPRCPPFPEGFVPPRDRMPSELLAEDLEALARLHPESHEVHRRRWRGV